MKKTLLEYTVMIRKEGKDYIAHVPSLGISDFGSTLAKVQKNVKNAIICHLEGLKKTGEEIPTPDANNYYVSHVSIPMSGNFHLAI